MVHYLLWHLPGAVEQDTEIRDSILHVYGIPDSPTLVLCLHACARAHTHTHAVCLKIRLWKVAISETVMTPLSEVQGCFRAFR
jgi:hypothetical protein